MVLPLFMFGVGFLLIGLGLYRFRKPFSAAYFAKTPYTVASAYGSIPLGFMAVLWGIAFLPFVAQTWARVLFLGGFAIGIVGTIISIQFCKPTWLKWLEQEYYSIIPFLQNEAREVGYKSLDQRIKSKQDLQEWVAEVRYKHKV